jgi:O-antigen/teichoic acid export membrane protein
MPESLKHKTVKGVLWSGAERFSVQGVNFLVMLVIARILDPKDFGLIGMLAIFMAVAQSLIDSGFSQALIRKQDRSEVDNSTVFYFNIVVSIVLYFILFLIAPLVAEFFNEPLLCRVMRVLCLIVVINSFAVVQRAIYTADINFKVQAKASFIAAVVSGIVGVTMAVTGHGVWSLVWQQLVNAFVNVLMLWMFSTWHPKLVYSWASFRDLFSFGSKLMVSGLIDTIYNNLYQLVVGKVFSATSLGHFTQAKSFTNLPSANITTILQRVTYPVLCTLQDDDEKLRKDYRQLIRLGGFVVFPLMCGLAGVAYPLVEVLLGAKWRFTATLIIPLCFNLMWFPVAAINLNLLQVKGRSDLFLKLEIIKKIIGVTVLVVSIPFGLVFMTYARIFSGMLGLYLNTYYTKKLINVGFLLQMKDLSATFLTSVVMFALVFGTTCLIENVWIKLFVGIILGSLIFVGIAMLYKFPEVGYLKSILRR